MNQVTMAQPTEKILADIRRYAIAHPFARARKLAPEHFGFLPGGIAVALSVNK